MNQPPVSVSRIIYLTKSQGGVAARPPRPPRPLLLSVPSLTTTEFLELPKLSVAALRFTNTARARIEAAGGECLTLDQLATRAPTVATPSSSVAPRTPVRPSSTSASARTRTRSPTSAPRAASSRRPVVAVLRVASRCKEFLRLPLRHLVSFLPHPQPLWDGRTHHSKPKNTVGSGSRLSVPVRRFISAHITHHPHQCRTCTFSDHPLFERLSCPLVTLNRRSLPQSRSDSTHSESRNFELGNGAFDCRRAGVLKVQCGMQRLERVWRVYAPMYSSLNCFFLALRMSFSTAARSGTVGCWRSSGVKIE